MGRFTLTLSMLFPIKFGLFSVVGLTLNWLDFVFSHFVLAWCKYELSKSFENILSFAKSMLSSLVQKKKRKDKKRKEKKREEKCFLFCYFFINSSWVKFLAFYLKKNLCVWTAFWTRVKERWRTINNKIGYLANGKRKE